MSKINLIIQLNKTVNITFDKNGGSCSQENKEVTYNSTYGSLPTATKSGREFAGWYTAKYEGNQIVSATKVSKRDNHTLYARWAVTVTFNPNGGVCNKTREKVIEGNKYGTLPVPTRAGYIFNGWYTASTGGTKVMAGTTVPEVGNHTLYAHWTPALYMVLFDANGGTCGVLNKQVTYDNMYGELPTPTKEGNKFLGWYTEINNGTKVTADTVVKTAAQHTLFAHWDEITYTITYNGNGGLYNGASTWNEAAIYNKEYTISNNVFTRQGYKFKGWNEKADGTGTDWTSKIGKPLTWSYTRNITLYAIWEKVEYTVTFNANGGNCSLASKNVTIGTKYGELPTPTRTGYTFAGWFTVASGGTQITSNTTVTSTQNHTLYAHWNINKYTVAYNANGGSGAPESQTKTYGVDLTLSSKAPTRGGYEFKGWGTSSSATSATYQPGGKYTSNNGITLYAVWQKIIDVTSITLNLTEDQWIPYIDGGNNGTLSLTATVSPNNATNKTVKWESSNDLIATVDSNGKVTATGAGVVTIQATAGGKSATVDVYVYNLVFKEGYSWNMYNGKRGTKTGIFKAQTGGAKMIIESLGDDWFKLSNYINGKYTSGNGNFFVVGTSNRKYFTSYGLW